MRRRTRRLNQQGVSGGPGSGAPEEPEMGLLRMLPFVFVCGRRRGGHNLEH